ncbi:ABC transporter substrate-binding protein [Agrobacterium vitis]|uniref:ABC transporter substrate-binding protein n=1 Tax=Agrobacterium vitis TaxID=373 RepID=UPI0009BFB22A|nr:ABC transporter substrate-binding protein [Agrobacterium vitis]KAA3517792.1 ABC transporter substrate-binding protein [Agrobacterium vitis]NOJ33064.1 ABC transporter substrate-binding protein [Agrobacterium vitis]RCU53379.1 ABC transporter substrate-binding protein [Agrobacterium vitis]
MTRNYLTRLLLSASAFALTGALAVAQAADVVIASSGGASQKAQREALWKPAAKVLGMSFSEETSQNWGEARAQVDANAVVWDIVQLSLAESQLVADAGVISKLPADIVNKADFIPGSVNDYCVGVTVYSTVIGYATEGFGGNSPKDMKDFWDVKKFPGKRGMYRAPRGNLEAAVLALGHPRSEIYKFLSTPEGRKAAMDKIAELKPNVIWWESGAQSMQLVKDGEVPLIYGWNGRIQAAVDAGAKYKFTFNDGLLNIDCYGIVKGSPNPENAIKFLKEISKAEYSKDLPKYISYGSPNLKASEGYDAATLSRLPSSPENVAVQYAADVNFWNTYGAELSEAFDSMLLTR